MNQMLRSTVDNFPNFLIRCAWIGILMIFLNRFSRVLSSFFGGFYKISFKIVLYQEIHTYSGRGSTPSKASRPAQGVQYFYQCRIYQKQGFCMRCTNFVKIFQLLQDLPKLGLLCTNVVKRFLLMQDLPKLGLLWENDGQKISTSVGFTKIRAFEGKCG